MRKQTHGLHGLSACEKVSRQMPYLSPHACAEGADGKVNTVVHRYKSSARAPMAAGPGWSRTADSHATTPCRSYACQSCFLSTGMQRYHCGDTHGLCVCCGRCDKDARWYVLPRGHECWKHCEMQGDPTAACTAASYSATLAPEPSTSSWVQLQSPPHLQPGLHLYIGKHWV